MDILKTFVADLPYPIFIIDTKSRVVIYANKLAREAIDHSTLFSTTIEDLIKIIELPVSNRQCTYLDNSWFDISRKELKWEEKDFQIIELKKRKDIPGDEIIEQWKNMIALILHRFRSPLNGITGFFELLEDENEDQQLNKRFTSIHKGFDHIYNMMDELEVLYNISRSPERTDFSPVSIQKIVDEVLIWFKEAQKNRINIHHGDDLEISSHPSSLKEALKLILTNSLEHSSDPDIQVNISKLNGVRISIKNRGGPIPEDIREQIFHPFVTTKATNFGIGLTKALLYARHLGGTIFLEQENDAVYFILYFPLSS